MGFFSFIENFFFLSLAITFVLILLLVYHFKQRITSLEQKNDTMFEIANGLVKEVGSMKAYLLSNMSTQINYPFNHISLHKIDENNNAEDEYDADEDGADDENDAEDDAEDDAEEDDEDEDDDDDTEDDNEDDAEEDDEDDADADADTEDEDDIDDEGKDSHKEDINENEYYGTIDDEDMVVEEINDIVIDDTENDANDTNRDEEELKIVEVSLDDKDNHGLDMKEDLIVNKIETPLSSINDISTVQTKVEIDSYKKMNVHQLKAFIIEKGYTTDFKNLKRNDLIKIIEENETK
jgi:hypothetical protein